VNDTIIADDAIRKFCEKHLAKIKLYVEDLASKCPTPSQCIVEGEFIFVRNIKKYMKK